MYRRSALAMGLTGVLLAQPRALGQQITVQWTATCPERLVLGEPVVATLSFNSSSRTPVTIDLGDGGVRNLMVHISGPGHIDTWIRGPLLGGLQRTGKIGLPPGGQASERLLLSSWLQFPSPGRYEIELKLLAPAQDPEGRPAGQLEPVHLSFELEPRNEAALRAACDRLANAVLRANSVEERLFAAHSLATMDDPVAAQCIDQVVSNSDRDDPILMPALARIGTQEAKDVLLAAANSPNAEKRALAENALRHWKAREGSAKPQ